MWNSRSSLLAMTAAFLFCMGGTKLLAQEAAEDGWSIYQRFQGSSSDYGQILKLETGVSRSLNRHVSIGIGLPGYLVRSTSDTDSSVRAGLGNAYVNLGFSILPDGPLRYASSVKISAPTGNEDQGFSTGAVTVGWSNNFSLPRDRLTPFVNFGLSNTVSDTSFFTRPFSSLGVVTQFQGGAQWAFARALSAGASGYAVIPSGEQTIVSRVLRTEGVTPTQPGRPFEIQHEVVGDADLARDHGFSTWLNLLPRGRMGLYAGYTRSFHYDMNSVFFGIGWSFTGL